jgi:exosortase/archaeosortase family protein
VRVKNAWPPVQGEDIALTKRGKWFLSTQWRVILLLAFIAIEIVGLRFAIHRPKTSYSFLFPVGRFEALLYFCFGFLLFLSGNITQVWRTLVDAAEHHRWQRTIALQVVCYIFIIYFSSKFYPTDLFAFKEHSKKYETVWTLALATSIFITFTLSLLIIAPKAYWQRFAKTEKTKLLFALIFPVSHAIISFLAEQSHDILSRPTVKVSAFILELLYPDIRTAPHSGLVGRPNFVVIVDKMCSGYVGIGMIFVFLTWYLFTFKSKFRFPAVLLAFPIGATLIWLSNCLRIALLVSIGSSLSSEIAMQGFHVSSGWIFFITISVGMMAIIRNSRFFSKNVGENRIVIDSVDALAIPF